MTKAKITRRKNNILRIKNHFDWTWAQMAQEVGCSERTLVRSLTTGEFRNNAKGHAVERKLDYLITEVPSGTEPVSPRKGKRGSPMSAELKIRINEFKAARGLELPHLADIFNISKTHLDSVLKYNENISPEAVEFIVSVLEHHRITDLEVEAMSHVRPAVDDVSSSEDDTMIGHRFLLRRGLIISFQLPSDLTYKEAKRLSQYVRSLPLEN